MNRSHVRALRSAAPAALAVTLTGAVALTFVDAVPSTEQTPDAVPATTDLDQEPPPAGAELPDAVAVTPTADPATCTIGAWFTS